MKSKLLTTVPSKHLEYTKQHSECQFLFESPIDTCLQQRPDNPEAIMYVQATGALPARQTTLELDVLVQSVIPVLRTWGQGILCNCKFQAIQVEQDLDSK